MKRAYRKHIGAIRTPLFHAIHQNLTAALPTLTLRTPCSTPRPRSLLQQPRVLHTTAAMMRAPAAGGAAAGILPLCLLLLLAMTPLLPLTEGCSTTVVGRKASATGAVMASHSNDGDGCFCHSSVNRVLASDWPPNATRNVKGHAIPQVAHTYAYHTEGYAAMNEHQVGLAESTCSGRKFPATVSTNGLFAPFVYKNDRFTKTGSGQT
jgi:hypothetical protein